MGGFDSMVAYLRSSVNASLLRNASPMLWPLKSYLEFAQLP
jgi:hypothetical protein